MKINDINRLVVLIIALLFAAGLISAKPKCPNGYLSGTEEEAQQGDPGNKSGRGNARLAGNVTDLDGKSLVNIEVQIVFSQNENLKYKTATNKKGEFSFFGLGSGYWNLTAFSQGYDLVSKSVNVSQVAVNPAVKIKMKKAEKPGGVLIYEEASMAFLDKGNQFYRERKFDEAIAQFELFIDKNPAAYQVRLSIADCYREKGEFEKAEPIYFEIIERSKTDAAMGRDLTAKALTGLGNIMVKQNKLAEAQEFFKQSIESSPKDEVLAYNVGEIYFSNQGLDEALKYFQLASVIKPDWPDSYLKLGYVYLNKADNTNAILKFEKFLTLEPDGERAAMVKNILDSIRR
jgi:tetratricopeptide (TPR) repeat protein